MLFFKLDQLWLKVFHTFRKLPAKLLIDNLIIPHNYRIRLNVQLRVFKSTAKKKMIQQSKNQLKENLTKNCRTQFIEC